jgi:GT2 family glycosyltransferase
VGINLSPDVELLVSNYKSLEITYLGQTKPGIVGAANEALSRMKNEIFVRIDDDVILDTLWYENLIQTFQSDERVGGVTGPTIMSDEGLRSRDLTAFLDRFQKSKNPILRLLHFLYHDVLYEGQLFDVSKFLDSGVFTIGSNYPSALDIREPHDVDTLEACNWAARRHLLNEVGGFDEVFTRGLSDYHESDAAMKIKALGTRLIFNPKVSVRHCVETGKVKKARPAAMYRMHNFIIFYFRHFRITSMRQLGKFLLNLSLQNGYYFYRFLTTGAINQLGAVPGTILWLIRIVFERSQNGVGIRV